MKHILLAIILVAGLTACHHNPEIVVPPEATVTINQEALKPCSPLQKLPELLYTDLEADMQIILGTSATNAIIFSECKNKQNDSIKLLKQFANIKENTDVPKSVTTP